MSPILGIFASGITKSKIITGAFESIATATGTGSSGTITFSSIPSGYTSLQIRGIVRSTQAATTLGNITVRFNSDSTSANYARHAINADATNGITAQGDAGQPSLLYSTLPYDSQLASTMGAFIMDVHDYASTTRNKTMRAISGLDNNNTTAGSQSINLISGLWMNTNAITSISFIAGGTGNFTTSTSIALYGIKGA